MAIEIVSFPSKHGDFPQLCQPVPEGKSHKNPTKTSCLTPAKPQFSMGVP